MTRTLGKVGPQFSLNPERVNTAHYLTLSALVPCFIYGTQGSRWRSNPGLELANAFGVSDTNPELELANAFGVSDRNTGLELANAFGVNAQELA